MRICLSVSILVLTSMGCGGGGVIFDPIPIPDDGPQLSAGCTVIHESDAQAYLQIGGAFDQLRHDEGPGDEPIKMTTKIDEFIRQNMCDDDVPGVALGIVWQGNLVYVKGYGLARGWESIADPSDDVPVRGQRTRFRWASVSKCVTGLAAVIASQEMGPNGPLFDLDANLAANYRCGTEFCTYQLPDTRYLGWNSDVDNLPWPLGTEGLSADDDILTPRRLLSCFGGIMHYGEGDPDLPSGKPSEADRELNAGFVWAVDYFTDLPLVRLPATTWNYSSFGFNMAGAALSWVLPSNFSGYVQTRIADVTLPSSMIYFHPDDIYDPQYQGAPWFTDVDRVHGYTKNTDTDVVSVNKTPHDVSYKLPSGGFISTVADMALFAEGLLNNRFMNQSGMDALFTPQENLVKGLGGTPTEGYALGFGVEQQSGERMVRHNGKQEDTRTRLVIFPDGEDPAVGQLGIVLMSNAEFFDRTGVANQIETFLRNPYEEDSIVFEGLLPRNQDYATQDAENRDTFGPYADGGEYLDPQLDRYAAPRIQIRRGHTYNPNYAWAPRVPSPHVERDDSREVSIRDETRGPAPDRTGR